MRVTAVPGINASYKSAQTFAITMAAIDPHRADGRIYEWDYEPLDAAGEIVTKSANTIDWQ